MSRYWQHPPQSTMAPTDNNDNFRSTFAQLVAALGFSTICTSVGLVIAMPTIVIGALRTDEHSALRMTEEEASWFGSLAYMLQPLGCLLAAFLQDIVGRKRCLVLVNVPMLVGWLLIYYATSVVHLFVAICFMGVSMGFMEAPILSYIGEITQPRLRGLLSSCGGLWANVGLMIESFLGATLPWRDMVFYSMAGPIASFIIMALMPESPAWLVSKGRIREAEKAFQWLRGWVGPEDIKNELDTLVAYVKETQEVKAEYIAVPQKEGGSPKPKSTTSWRTLLEPDVLVALRIVFIFFIVSTCVTLFAMRPFFIEVLVSLQLPLSPHMVVVVCGVLQMLGAVSLAVGLKLTGKRQLSFLSIGISVVVCLGLAFYLWTGINFPWLPVVLFSLSYFSASLGVLPLPWILVMELFPLRVRGFASGLSGAFAYVTMFLAIKVYYGMAALLGVAGVCFVYGVVGLLGIIYLYWDMPETEGVALEDIERLLSERRAARSERRVKK